MSDNEPTGRKAPTQSSIGLLLIRTSLRLPITPEITQLTITKLSAIMRQFSSGCPRPRKSTSNASSSPIRLSLALVYI